MQDITHVRDAWRYLLEHHLELYSTLRRHTADIKKRASETLQ